MRRLRFALIAGALALGFALPAGAAAANPSQTCEQTQNTFFVEIPGVGSIPLAIPSKGGCVSSYATGNLSNAAFIANCKALEAEVGGYPYAFYGNPAYTAENRADCVYFLRAFHSGQLPPGPG